PTTPPPSTAAPNPSTTSATTPPPTTCKPGPRPRPWIKRQPFRGVIPPRSSNR
ncbi:MAG: serine protease, partial [Acidimicrobiia bacterium]|nr:serine protease [Acidimicrobiia bacterium]